MNTLIEYLKEVKAELVHVTWPSRNQTIYYTAGVVIISLVTAYYLGYLDSILAKGLEFILNS